MPCRIGALALMILASAGFAIAEPVKTSKERLSDKAADDQRIDNCRVPLERRGPTIRPDCPGKAVPTAGQAHSGPPAPR